MTAIHSGPQSDAHLRSALRDLYAAPFSARSWRCSSDHAFIGITLIERSIALLARELQGDLLDVGCGKAPYNGYFPHVRSRRGCDYSPARGTVDFVSSAVRLPVRDACFDSILCTEVLEHVPDPMAAWQEFHRVLRPGGAVLLTTPMYWPSHEQPFDFYRYPEHGLRYLAETAGFDVVRLVPRGGVWAMLGQVTLHVMPQYFRFAAQRTLWNRALLWMDQWRCNPTVTIGWTILARKAA